MTDRDTAIVILLLLALAVAGFFILFNIFPVSLMHIGFNEMSGFFGVFYTLLLRLAVAPLMIGLSLWAVYKMITE